MRALFICLLLVSSFSSAWQVLPSAEPTRDASGTFSFPIHSHLSVSDGLIVGAATPNESKNYALSIFDYVENVFRPYAHEKVTLNGVAKQENPLFNNAIPLLAMMDERTMVLGLQSDLKRIFVTAFPECKDVLTSPIIKDANGHEIDADIVALAGGNNCAYVAINGKGETAGSAVAVFTVQVENKEVALTQEEYDAIKKYVQDSGDEGAIEQFSKEINTDKDGKHTRKVVEKKLVQICTAPLSVASDCIKIRHDARSLEVSALHWCPNLKRIFIGTKVRGNQGASDGACGLLVANIEDSKLVLRPLMGAAFADQNQIAVAKGSNAAVSIHAVRSMFTTTGLDYLIVQGGNGLPDATTSNVFALPLLNFHGIDGQFLPEQMNMHGTIADHTATPLVAFAQTDRAHLFMGRHFNAAPQSPATVVNQHSAQAVVGGGPLTAGPTEDLFVRDDAVYAIVNKPYSGHHAGIYCSQPIFAENGAIAAWTAWQPKAVMHDELISGMTIAPAQGALIVASGDSQDSARTVKRTVWSDSKNGGMKELVALVEQHFPKAIGGVQALFEHGDYLGVLGLGKAVLFDVTSNAATIFADAVVQDLGPLIAGQIIERAPGRRSDELWRADSKKLLVLGGLNGVAVADLNNCQSGFKRIGNFTFVRKILVDEDFLYILTDRSFERITINANNIMTGEIDAVQLADSNEITKAGDYGIFLDCAVSHKCALIAHSAGLHRVGNAKDIRADNAASMNWTPMAIPDCTGPVVSLIPISISGHACDWARGPAGQLYVISGSIANNSAKLHRFAIATSADAPIGDATIAPLQDFVAQNQISSFVNIGNFTPLFATDGTLFLTTATQRKKKSKYPVLVNSFKKGKSVMPLSLESDASINCLMRHTKTGNWIVGGDFGLIVNE